MLDVKPSICPSIIHVELLQLFQQYLFQLPSISYPTIHDLPAFQLAFCPLSGLA
jgi:hypothetical protein